MMCVQLEMLIELRCLTQSQTCLEKNSSSNARMCICVYICALFLLCVALVYMDGVTRVNEAFLKPKTLLDSCKTPAANKKSKSLSDCRVSTVGFYSLIWGFLFSIGTFN